MWWSSFGPMWAFSVFVGLTPIGPFEFEVRRDRNVDVLSNRIFWFLVAGQQLVKDVLA